MRAKKMPDAVFHLRNEPVARASLSVSLALAVGNRLAASACDLAHQSDIAAADRGAWLQKMLEPGAVICCNVAETEARRCSGFGGAAT
jgi:hypothetical protein